MDPRVYHWDTLFVKGKEMWRHAGEQARRPPPAQAGSQGRPRLCYHGKPEHAIYALAEVSRDPYPDPHDKESKILVMDLRAIERLPRQVTLSGIASEQALKKIKFLKNTRLTICPSPTRNIPKFCAWRGSSPRPEFPFLSYRIVGGSHRLLFQFHGFEKLVGRERNPTQTHPDCIKYRVSDCSRNRNDRRFARPRVWQLGAVDEHSFDFRNFAESNYGITSPVEILLAGSIELNFFHQCAAHALNDVSINLELEPVGIDDQAAVMRHDNALHRNSPRRFVDFDFSNDCHNGSLALWTRRSRARPPSGRLRREPARTIALASQPFLRLRAGLRPRACCRCL